MNVSLSSDLLDFVRKKVESGDLPSEEAVLQEAVRRFQQNDQPGPGFDQKAIAEDLIDYEAIHVAPARSRARTCPRLRRSAGCSRRSPARWPRLSSKRERPVLDAALLPRYEPLVKHYHTEPVHPRSMRFWARSGPLFGLAIDADRGSFRLREEGPDRRDSRYRLRPASPAVLRECQGPHITPVRILNAHFQSPVTSSQGTGRRGRSTDLFAAKAHALQGWEEAAPSDVKINKYSCNTGPFPVRSQLLEPALVRKDDRVGGNRPSVKSRPTRER